MYYYGNQGGLCGNTTVYPVSNSNKSNYAIVLVLFILLVIIIGTRWNNN